MGKFIANPLTVRFSNVYKLLKEQHEKAGKAFSKAEFGRKCGTYPNIINDVLALSMNPVYSYTDKYSMCAVFPWAGI